MSENVSSTDKATPQAPTAVSPPMFGSPGSDFRWLMPIVLSAGVFAVALLVTVVLPMRHAANVEPDPTIQAILSDNVMLLQIRLWTILLTAMLIGGAMAIAGARQNSKALVRLEMRLRLIVDRGAELPPTLPAKDFVQFDEVFAGLRSELDRAARRHLPVLQQTQRSLSNVSQQVAAGKATQAELRKSLSAVVQELDVALEAERRSSRARSRMG